MSGSPVSGERLPISKPVSLSNSNGGAISPTTGVSVNSNKPNSVPVHHPASSVLPLPPAQPMDTSQQQPPPQMDTSTIPPLMGIRPIVSSNHPTPPVQLPSTISPPPAQLPPPAIPGGTQTTTHPSTITPGPPGSATSTVPATGSSDLKKLLTQVPPSQRKQSQVANAQPGKEFSGKQMKGKDDNGAQPKLPILRLKKTCGDDDSFEKQDVSKNDSYCWVCHDGGDVLCCDKCPRVFHSQCSGLQQPPEDEDNEWFCSICKNIARKTKRARPPNLKELLLLAVERMMFPGTEIFQSPVPPDIMTHYREYVFFPMYLGKIKEKVASGLYQSTREFTHDTEWILHNCIIYNGAKHALTKIAKNIVKVCKEDMREIELCPGCYMLTVKQPKDWFCIPCNPPHPVVLAKVRGYPLWPAKLISETSDKCDVRFFGQHDRSLVPKCDIQALNGLPPKPSTKTKHWNQAMFELKKYGENIEAMREKLGGVKDKSLKVLLKDKGKSGQNPNSQNQDSNKQKHMNKDQFSVSNHTSLPPPVVEVTPSDEGDTAASISDADISSPGSPPILQIDLGSGSAPNNVDKSPNRGRAMPSGHGRSLIGAINRSQVPGTLDFNGEGGPQAVVMGSPSTTPKVKTRKGMKKAGDTLSALVSSLAQRKRVAEMEMGGKAGGLTPVHKGAVFRTPGDEGGGAGGQNDAESGKQKGAVEDPKDKKNSPFSSIYEYRNKTAIALVDPNQKRAKRRTPKVTTGSEPPAKKARPNTSGAATESPISATNGKPDGEVQSLNDPAAYVARIQEFGNVAISALSNTTGTNPSPSSSSGSQQVANLKADAAKVRNSVSVSPQNTSGSSNSSNSVGLTPALPGIPKTSRTGAGGGKKKTGKKTVDKNRGKSPSKAANKTAGVDASKTTSSISTSSSFAPPVTTTTTNAKTNLTIASKVSHGASSSHDSPSSSGSAEIRGEVAAPGMSAEEGGSGDFAEGSGLLADTIRKVNSSFMARVNQMTGSPDDMGYKYFVEKLMSSIKTVLLEMLSMFDAKSRLSGKQLREQLHNCWPASNSSIAMEQLGKELRDEMKQSLEVVRASAALELEQVVNEVRRQVEKEKEIAVSETKKKKWCSYCWKEAQYNCCWNANYCNELCQQSHWQDHMDNCTQVQQQAAPHTPAPQMSVGTPVQKAPAAQLSPTLAVSSIPSGVGGASGGGTGQSMVLSGGQDPQQHGFMFPGAAAAAAHAQAQAQAQAHAQAQAQIQQVQSQQAFAQAQMQAHLQQQQQQQSAGGNAPSPMGLHTSNAQSQQQQVLSGGGGTSSSGSLSSALPHALHPSHHQHIRQSGAGLRPDQHHGQGSPLLHVDGMHHPMETTPTPAQIATPTGIEQSVAHIERLSNDNMITTANTASPPNHIRNMLLSQQHHQQSSKSVGGGGVVTGSNPILMGHQSPAPPAHGIHTPPLGGLSSDHSTPSNSSSIMHGQPPISPATPPSENPPSVHNYGGWTYPHPQVIIGGNESYPHGLPLLPTMQANTPTTQNHAFFKAAF